MEKQSTIVTKMKFQRISQTSQLHVGYHAHLYTRI
jgi:hypothetical protein